MIVPARAASLGEQLAALLRSRVVIGDLPAGTHLVEDALAADHDVSRGPVRDALRALKAEGLVESRRRGFYVRGFTRQDVEELYQVRSAIEQLACTLAIAVGAAQQWTDADRELDAMRAAADNQDWRVFAAHDLAFHSVFYDVCGNGRLANLWQQYRPTFAVLLDITNSQDADLRPSLEDHVLLLQLAKNGETQRFSSVLEEHLNGSKDRMCSALATHWETAG